MSVRRDIGDTIDDSLEMPEEYGSRIYWRYNQVVGLIGLVAVPILIAMSFLDGTTKLGRVASIGGWIVIAVTAIFFILRDIKVQRRIDKTGSPLVEREPY